MRSTAIHANNFLFCVSVVCKEGGAPENTTRHSGGKATYKRTPHQLISQQACALSVLLSRHVLLACFVPPPPRFGKPRPRRSARGLPHAPRPAAPPAGGRKGRCLPYRRSRSLAVAAPGAEPAKLAGGRIYLGCAAVGSSFLASYDTRHLCVASSSDGAVGFCGVVGVGLGRTAAVVQVVVSLGEVRAECGARSARLRHHSSSLVFAPAFRPAFACGVFRWPACHLYTLAVADGVLPLFSAALVYR